MDKMLGHELRRMSGREGVREPVEAARKRIFSQVLNSPTAYLLYGL
jgi:hypothetical protein